MRFHSWKPCCLIEFSVLQPVGFIIHNTTQSLAVNAEVWIYFIQSNIARFILHCYDVAFFFLFYNHYLHSFVFFLVSKLRHALAYCRIEFLKTNRKIDAAERGASAENSILPEISCCAKPDIDLTKREIAAGDSDRENWGATSFNKVGTTIFEHEDNRAPQCNTRITNCRSSRSTERVPQQNPFPLFHWGSMLSGLQSQNNKGLITCIIEFEVRERCRYLIKIERKNPNK